MSDINNDQANLVGNQHFTVMDLKSRFHLINLREEDRKNKAFSINNGKIEFTTLPIRLNNPPSIFQSALDDMLK